MYRQKESIVPQQKRWTVKPRECRESKIFIRKCSKLCDSDYDIVDEAEIWAMEKGQFLPSVMGKDVGYWGILKIFILISCVCVCVSFVDMCMYVQVLIEATAQDPLVELDLQTVWAILYRW